MLKMMGNKFSLCKPHVWDNFYSQVIRFSSLIFCMSYPMYINA